MAIEIRFFASLREAVGRRAVIIEQSGDATIRDVLAMLEADYPGLAGRLLDDDTVADSIVVLVNGRPITHLNEERTRVRDSDQISLTLPISGGCAAL